MPSLKNADWLTDVRTRAVFDCLDTDGIEARVVGGAVRNALLGQPVKDIDIATPAKPDAVIKAANAAGLKVIPTGIDHGTVTVVSQSTPFEITTLRRDVKTDGRHAVVAFTDDWAEDAKRRDFTINALYCSKDGVLFDPVGGLDDISQHRVRFVGDADTRIAEDYLRILRFFRFTATYGKGQCDAAGLASCAKLRDGLDQLSGERIQAELKKLLVAPFAGDVISAMDTAKILTQLFQPAASVALFNRVIAIDAHFNQPGDFCQRLAALAVHRTSDAAWLQDRLRLSARAFGRLSQMITLPPPPPPDSDEQDAKAFLYTHGVEAYRDALLLAWANSDDEIGDRTWKSRLDLTERWPIPAFPISGDDVLALGVPPGPHIGRILAEVEAWWISEGFPSNRNKLHHHLAHVTKVTKF